MVNKIKRSEIQEYDKYKKQGETNGGTVST